MCGQSLVYFGSSVIYINGVHIHNRQNYYCAGAIISFNFSFDANVVSNIADIMINIEIADRVSKRCRIRTSRVYGQQQFAESVEAEWNCNYKIMSRECGERSNLRA